MRSKVSAITAHAERPVPFAAQSRDDPEPYSLPASTTGHPAHLVADRRVVDAHELAERLVERPAALRARRELVPSRMLANVPRIITSWLPRRARMS